MRHGRALGDVLRTRPDFFGDNSPCRCWFSQVRGHAHVHHDDRSPDRTSHGIDSGAAVHEIKDHLRGDFRRILADAFGRYPVVGRHGYHGFPGRCWARGSGHPRQIFGQVHQAPESPMRHSELFEPRPGLGATFRILRLDTLNGLFKKIHHSTPFRCSGKPQAMRITSSAPAAMS